MRLLRRRAEGGAPRRPGQPNSLFGEILDWMLAPLLFLWPLSILFTHNVAGSLADQPYDLVLADNVRALARLVRIHDGAVWVDFPASPRMLFRSDQDDVLYFQVARFGSDLVIGDRDLPRVRPPGQIMPEAVAYRDEFVLGEAVRVAYQFIAGADGGAPVLVQVAETRNKRDDLASRVVTGVLLPQFAVIPLVVVLVWLGLARGIAPLNRLQDRIRRRSPTDLSPIAPASAPEEVRPLIVSFNDMMQRLEANLQAQQRFIADAAHQMRTPLTGLRSQTELALRERDAAELRASLERIAASAERASHLINQLLLLARAEAGSERLHLPQQCDLAQLAREIGAELFPVAQARRLDFGVEADEPVRCAGHALLLRELLKNLIDNAIKYTPQGGRVTVRVSHAEGARIEVEDDGVGIPESERARVFERFYRVLESGEDGSGLGLAIVREIAILHGATVAIDTAPGGRGTLVRVDFPRGSGT